MRTYKHTFKDGSAVTLMVDMSGDRLKIKATNYPTGNSAEYIAWRDGVVVPDIIENMNLSQLIAAEALGKKMKGQA